MNTRLLREGLTAIAAGVLKLAEAFDVDSPAGAPAESPAPARPNGNGRAREAFPAKYAKRCEECGERIEVGSPVFWGHERGQLRHAACAGAATPAPPAAEPPPAEPPPAPPGDDFGSGDFEIPF